ATSIRKQDWFAVIIETLIVVMGVYLGIQLGNWNSERQQHADADRYIVQFSQTLDETAEHLETMLEFYDGVLNDGALALDQLENAELTDAERENIYSVIAFVQQVRPIDPLGLGELASRPETGEVMLRDRDLEIAIDEFRASLGQAEGVVVHVTQRLNSYLGTMDQYNAIGPVLPQDRQDELFLEAEALENPSFRIALAGALNMVRYRAANMAIVLQECRELQDAIIGGSE
ncbi:MAG TPA: hypothetical protein DDZ43_00200, partial [Hyphomonadaceae bacterium]|nr:hypothetical protein [Hyphomonadaceae bacterium]